MNYIERFASQIVPSMQDDCFYVHSGLTYNAYDATGGAAQDDYADTSNVLLLLPLNNNVTDFSPSPHTITNHNATFSITNPNFSGIYYGLFDGNSAYLTSNNNSDYNFGSSDFTVDAWVNITQTDSRQYSIADKSAVGTGWTFYIVADGSGNYNLRATSFAASIILSVDVPLTINTWHHAAFVRNISNWTIYWDGSSVATTTGSDTITNSSTFSVGSYRVDAGNGNWFWGGISYFRITSLARWTSNFTPPVVKSFPTLTLSATTGTVVAASSLSYFDSDDVGNRIRAIDSNENVIGELLITGFTSATVITK